MTDEGMRELLDEMHEHCDSSSRSYRRHGRFYYFLSYLLTVTTVLASISAGALAILPLTKGNEALIGIVALIPAASASMASQLKLVDKANWFYNCSTEYKSLERDFQFLQASCATPDQIEKAKDRLSLMEVQADRGWSERLSFFFDRKP